MAEPRKYRRRRKRPDETKRVHRRSTENKSNIWSGIVDYPPDNVGVYERVFFANRSNGPCVYIYSGKKHTFFWRNEIPNSNTYLKSLAEKHGIKRGYFKVGDKILGGEYAEWRLYSMFPSLKRPDTTNADWSTFFWWFLNEGEQDTYKVCRVIKGIYPDGRGGGKIKTAGYINFEGYNLELAAQKESRINFNRRVIHDSYDFTVIIWLSKVVVKGSVIVLSGISKGITASAKHALKKVIIKESKKRASKKIRKLVFKAIYNKTSRALAAAVKDFIKEFVREMRKQEMRKKFFSRNKVNTLNWNIFQPALMNATVSFLSSLLDSEFGQTVGKEIRRSKVYSDMEKEIRTLVGKSIRKLSIMVFITAIKDADRKARNQNKDFWKVLEAETRSCLSTTIEDIFVKDIPGLSGFD